MSLQVESLHVDLAGQAVLREVGFSLAPGQTVAVVGRNGAGKTTLLRALMGLVRARSGRVLLDGQDLLTQAPHRRAAAGFGYAPEDRIILPTLTVQANVTLACEVLGLPRAQIAQRLDGVLHAVPQLAPLLPRSGAALSGGQGKIVALARALMVGTRFVLLDEPFQGLAPALARQYGDALKALRASQPQLCVLVTESNAALLDGIHSSTLHIERGRVSPRDMRSAPAANEPLPPTDHARPAPRGRHG
ncbi:MAG: ATP-binding cassette domain-containing protein [Rubrivivax sp.]